MKYVGCVHLYIPWKFGERGSTPRGATGPSLSFFCPSCYDARHRKPRRCIYALNLGGMGISPRTVLVIVLVFVFVIVFVLVLVLVLVPPTEIPPAPGTQQAATYSIAAVAGTWTILVFRTFILYDILWNIHFYFYLGGQSVSISFSGSPPTVQLKLYNWYCCCRK